MADNKRYFRIGIFAAAAGLFTVGVMLYLGLAEEFSERIHFVTSFSESVQGLTKGSPVKYKGVPIGQVDAISIMPSDKIIRVDMSIDPGVFQGFTHADDEDQRLQQIREFCIRSRDSGLCCYLDLAGVTGMRYVEMDYVPQSRKRPQPLPEINDCDSIYFPSVPSTFNNIVDSVATSLNKIASVDLAKLSSDLDKNLQAMHNILTDPAIKQSLDRLDNTMKNVEAVSSNLSTHITGEELKRFISGVNDNLNNINDLSKKLNDKFDQIDTDELSKQIGGALRESRMLLHEMRDGSSDAVRAMHQLSALIDNLNEFIDYVKKDPSSLVRGKNAPEVELR